MAVPFGWADGVAGSLASGHLGLAIVTRWPAHWSAVSALLVRFGFGLPSASSLI